MAVFSLPSEVCLLTCIAEEESHYRQPWKYHKYHFSIKTKILHTDFLGRQHTLPK